jgi:uncharacterized protein (TIGR02058 family)
MTKQQRRFIVEIGTGIDLHGEDVTKAACRAVRDAVSRSCLCGLVEIIETDDLKNVLVDIFIAVPRPEQVDPERVMAEVPIGRKTVRAEQGGLQTLGLCVPQFAPQCDQIIVANAAVTVFIDGGEK